MDGIKTRDTVKILVIKTLCVKILVNILIKTLSCQDFGDQDQAFGWRYEMWSSSVTL